MLTLQIGSKLFKMLPVKVRFMAFDAMSDVTRLMVMMFFTALIAYPTPEPYQFAAMICADGPMLCWLEEVKYSFGTLHFIGKSGAAFARSERCGCDVC
jgi:uncharacterized membrane protein